MTEGLFTILTVCQGNVHRSALAAALLRTWADWYLPTETAGQVRIGSAGLGAPEGARMERPVRELARVLGADGSAHRARQITDDLIREADLVLTASRRQRDDVIQRVPAALQSTFTIREAGRIAASLDAPDAQRSLSTLHEGVALLASHRHGAREAAEDDIADPQGRGGGAFVRMAKDEVPALATVAALLFGLPPADLEAYVAEVDRLDESAGAA